MVVAVAAAGLVVVVVAVVVAVAVAVAVCSSSSSRSEIYCQDRGWGASWLQFVAPEIYLSIKKALNFWILKI